MVVIWLAAVSLITQVNNSEQQSIIINYVITTNSISYDGGGPAACIREPNWAGK